MRRRWRRWLGQVECRTKRLLRAVYCLTGGGRAPLPFLWFQNCGTTGHEAAGRRSVFIGGSRITHGHDGAEGRRHPNKSGALGRRAWRLPFRYALARVRRREVAEDLVQDTLLAAIRSREKFAGQSSERSWLTGILRHKISDHFRKLGRETSFTDLDSLADEFSEKFVPEGYWVHVKGPKEWKPESDEVVHRAEFWQTMRHCLDKLPERIANVFVLREMDEVESKEICSMLSISASNLWVMLHRARMALRECLEINWFNREK